MTARGVEFCFFDGKQGEGWRRITNSSLIIGALFQLPRIEVSTHKLPCRESGRQGGLFSFLRNLHGCGKSFLGGQKAESLGKAIWPMCKNGPIEDPRSLTRE
jgi:hypothetical protein